MEYRLKTPLDGEEASRLRVGDIVYISGEIWTARDEAHKLFLEEGMPAELSSDGGALYHSGLLVREGKEGGYDLVSAGPTTSMRMEAYTPVLLEKFGVKLIIGKGGMGQSTLEALKNTGSAYASFLGGGGALGAEHLKVRGVHYLDRLGMPEAVWVLEAEEFGPLTITMDSTGQSLYEDVRKKAEKRMESMP